MFASQVAQPKKPRRAESKGLKKLTGHVFFERWTIFSGFAGLPKRHNADLLIQQVLSAKRRWRDGELLLNLKDLLTVLQPSLMRLFENEPILRGLFLCRIVPNSAIFCQRVARFGTKSTFFATDFCEDVLSPASREPFQRVPTPIGRQAESITRAPQRICRQAVSASHERAGWLVTDMVKLRKLIGGIVANFPLAFCHFGVKPLLQTNGLLGLVSFFGRFWGYQIVPNLTNSYQKRAASGLEQAVKGELTGGFHERFY